MKRYVKSAQYSIGQIRIYLLEDGTYSWDTQDTTDDNICSTLGEAFEAAKKYVRENYTDGKYFTFGELVKYDMFGDVYYTSEILEPDFS